LIIERLCRDLLGRWSFALPPPERAGQRRRPFQRGRGPVEVIRPEDRVFFEPGENHWHGAAPSRFMTHIAIQQADAQGNVVTWGEHVTGGKYAEAPSLDEGGR
jgi:hypothetical protein